MEEVLQNFLYLAEGVIWKKKKKKKEESTCLHLKNV